MLSQVYEPLIGLILPEACQRCGCIAAGGFCESCRAEFTRNDHACRICGCGPLPPGSFECAQHPSRWCIAHVVTPLVYAPPAEYYLHALKYSGERALCRAFGQLLADAAAHRRTHVDAIVSVPLHARRLIQRGYNQALEIARSSASVMHLPILRAGIARVRETAPQALLDSRQRRANLADAFAIDRNLNNLRLAVVDDVITTGSTVNTLAAALLDAGARHVEAWAVARTPPPTRHRS
ncbi:MAG: ComF family protein [Gammaproteobacteria bacterium]